MLGKEVLDLCVSVSQALVYFLKWHSQTVASSCTGRNCMVCAVLCKSLLSQLLIRDMLWVPLRIIRADE
jgi:hypothetical protein